MPVLPQYEQSQIPSQTVNANLPEFNNPLVGVAAQVGENLMARAVEMKNRENDFWALTTANQLQAQWQQEIAAEEQAGTWQDAGERLLPKFTDQASEALAQAPSADSKATLAIQLEKARFAAAARTAEFEYKGKINNAASILGEAQERTRIGILINPAVADTAVLEYNALVEQSPLPEPAKQELYRKANQGFRKDQFLATLYNDPEAANGLLGSSDFVAQLDPDDFLQFKQQIDATKARKKDYVLQEAKYEVAQAQKLVNDNPNKTNVNRLADAAARVAALEPNPVTIRQIQQTLLVAGTKAEVAQNLRTRPNNELASIAQRGDLPEDRKDADLSADQLVAKQEAFVFEKEYATRLLKAREENPLSATYGVYPELLAKRQALKAAGDPQADLQVFYTELRSAQDRLGMPFELLDGAAAKDLAQRITSNTDPARAVVELQDIKNNFGVENWPVVAAQLGSKLPDGYYGALIASNDPDDGLSKAQIVISALRDVKNNSDSKAVAAKDNTKLTEAIRSNPAIQAHTASFVVFDYGANGIVTGVRDAIQATALQEMARGVSLNAALDKATDLVLGGYELVESRVTGGVLRVPKQIKIGKDMQRVDPELVSAGLVRFVNNQFRLDNIDAPDQKTFNRYKDNLFARVSADETHIEFFADNKEGDLVKDSVERFPRLFFKNGNPIRVPITELMFGKFSKEAAVGLRNTSSNFEGY